MEQILSLFEFKYIDILGFLGQSLFGLRFLIQWIISEKKKKSVIPLIFWYISLSASIIIIIYSILIKNPVFFFGQLFGGTVYIRNIILYKDDISKQDTIQK
ncbi:MAG: lipid-A-disaccharide synthase N-terminal domain-containing protein [Planctomycetota bacterium]